jgi:hypothetical protein
MMTTSSAGVKAEGEARSALMPADESLTLRPRSGLLSEATQQPASARPARAVVQTAD